MPKNTPGLNVTYLDNQLNVGPQEVTLNESILIIGTAEDGPTDTVVRMRSPAYVRNVYGRNTVGDLVRKAEEAWYAQGGNQDIRLLRISNGRKAKLSIAEYSGRGLAKPQPTGESITGQQILTNPALVLEAKVPGSKYNQATIRMGYNPNGLLSVIFYNPKTGLDSYFTYSPDVNNLVVDVHNVRELAAAMAADPNTASIVTATAQTIEAHCDIIVDPQSNDGYTANSWAWDTGYWLSLWGYKYVDAAVDEVQMISATPGGSGSLPAGEYVYAVVAKNENGSTNAAARDNSGSGTEPAWYSYIGVVTAAGQEVVLNWEASVGETTGYDIYRGLRTVEKPTGLAGAGGAGPYYYVVTARDHYGESAHSATVGPYVGTVTLTWNRNTEAACIGYNIYRGTNAVGPYKYIGSIDQMASPTFTDNTLPTSEIYAPAVNNSGAKYKIAHVSTGVTTYTDSGDEADTFYLAPTTNSTRYWGGYAPGGAGGNLAKIGITTTNDLMRLNLSERLSLLANETGAPTLAPTSGGNGSYGAGIFKHFDGTTAAVSQTAGNRIGVLTKVAEFTATAQQVLNIPGYSRADLPYAPVKPPKVRYGNTATPGEESQVYPLSESTFLYTHKLRPLACSWAGGDDDPVEYDYARIAGRYGYDDADWSATGHPLHSSTADYADAKQLVVKGFIGVVPALDPAATAVEFEFAAHLPPDKGSSGRAPGDYDYVYLSSIYGDSTYVTGPNTIEVYEVVEGSSFVKASDLGHTWSITWEDPGGGQEPKAKLTFTGANASELPPQGASIYIDYNSLPGKLTQVDNMISVMNKSGWDAWKTYFITGRRIYFGGPLPTAIQIAYCYEKPFSVGGEVSVLDYTNGIIEFPDAKNQPGCGINTVPPVVIVGEKPGTVPAPDWSSTEKPAAHKPGWARLILYYEYDPEWLDIGVVARALQGGSDGVNMSTSELYDALDEAYTMLANYRTDYLILPDGAYIDAVAQEPNPVTGLLGNVNAGFQAQLADFLAINQENVHETMAFMNVAPPSDTKISTINRWVQRLTVVDPSDPTRGANWMSVLNNRLIHVCAFFPIVANPSITKYISDGVASFVGAYAELPINEGMTYHSVPGWIGLAFELSPGQLEAMTAMRYITAKTDVHTENIVITDVPSCAAPGSDYARSTTTRIVRRVVDDVRRASTPFLGKLSEDAVYNAMATQISNVIKNHINLGSLRRGSTFSLVASPADRVRGIVNVRLSLAVNFEIRIINVTVALKAT